MNKPNTWSFSRLLSFEKCPLSITFPYREIDTAQTARGTELHKQMEDAVFNGAPHEIAIKFGIGEICKHPIVMCEPEWGFNRDWQYTSYRGAWLKIKPDLVYVTDDDVLTVVDYKTGKSDGNEIKHRQQLQLYTLAAAIMCPSINYFRAELWYLDEGKVVTVLQSTEPNRDSVLAKKDRWHQRGLALTDATDYPARPTRAHCKFCWENDRCPYAVVD